MGGLGRFKWYTLTICPKCGNIGGKHTQFPENEWKPCDCGTVCIKTGKTFTQYALLTPDERKEYDTYIREKYTLHSDVFDEELYKKTLEGDFERRLAIETEKREMQIQSANNSQPKCPTCGSADVQKISGLERGVSVVAWGLFSKKINKSFKCNKCGYTW